MYAIVDLSNVVKSGIFTGKDIENGYTVEHDGKTVQVNSADYGFGKCSDWLVRTISNLGIPPKNVIFVEEANETSLAFRRQIDPTYKTGKGSRPKDVYVELNKAINLLKKHWLQVGASFVTQANVEADDVIAYLAQRLPQSVMLTSDRDLQAAVSVNARLYHDGQFNQNRLGPFQLRHTTVYKATVGDSGDGIKGANLFGPKAFLDTYCLFGDEGLDALEDLIKSRQLDKLHEDVGQLKALQRLIDDRENVYKSYDLAKLYPERVNGYRRPLKWQVGVVRNPDADLDQALIPFSQQRKVVHAGNFQQALGWFKEQVKNAVSVALDIETTSGEDSDEWLEAKSKKTEDADKGVDQLGQTLCGFSVTFGFNDEFTIYAPVDHTESDGFKNITKQQAAELILAIPKTCSIVVHNAAFELSVLKQEIGQFMPDDEWIGFLPNILDTMLEASYVDENGPLGLKKLSASILNYEQQTFADVTKGKKMSELSCTEVFSYGCDDTICTAALHTHFKRVMEVEGTWQTYLDVEILPAYLTAQAFIDGTPISMETLLKQEAEDQAAYDAAWAVIRDFLIERGWPGSRPPTYAAAPTAAEIKEAYTIVTGKVLETQVRTPAKLVALIAAEGEEQFASMLTAALESESGLKSFEQFVKIHFKGEPTLNMRSPKQLQDFLYGPNYLGLEIRVFNPPTDKMRQEGLRVGSPSTDDLALQYALHFDAKTRPEVVPFVKALQTVRVTQTRMNMYYKPYRFVRHWKTGLVHASMNQCATNTRRYSSSSPNLQQLPKHPKSTGEPAKFREVFIPHKADAVIVSLDFDAQELRIIADASKDPNMLACFMGDTKRDMHSLTGVGILQRRLEAGISAIMRTVVESGLQALWREDKYKLLGMMQALAHYEAFDAAYDDITHPLHKLTKVIRALGKKVNFTTEYGAQAPKLGKTMLVETDEAQQYIDAKLEAFPEAAAWKERVVEDVKRTGIVRSMMGAVRHLGPALLSYNSGEASKAERQAVNYYVQGSAAEMTKLAMARVWKARILQRFDCRFIAPIHDELVFSVALSDLVEFLLAVHPCMVAQFGSMAVPVLSSISVGPNFGKQYEIGTAVDLAKLESAVRNFVPDWSALTPREETYAD